MAARRPRTSRSSPPDGSHVAFNACNVRATVPKGAFYQCIYQVYSARIGEPPHAYAVTQPQPPTFGADGRYIYAASRDQDHADEPRDRGGCAYRMATDGQDAQKLFCTGLHDLELDTAPRSALLHGWRGVLGEQIHDYEWIELPSGNHRGTISIDRGTDNSSFSGEYLAASTQTGLVVADVRTQQRAPVALAPGETLWLSNQWKNPHTVYALRARLGTRSYEILEIDARAVLAAAQSPPASGGGPP